jgi:hypothetical protein
MIRQHKFNITDIPCELGRDIDFPSQRFDHQYMELLSPDKQMSAAVMRSSDHAWLSLTDVKLTSGLVLPYVLSLQVGHLMNGSFHELRRLIEKKEVGNAH